jgi:hypothetical protein
MLPRKSAWRRGPSVRLLAVRVPPLHCPAFATWRQLLARSRRVGYHPPAPRCRPVPPIEISCAVGSGRFSLSPRSNWERREGTGSHRSRFVLARRGLYSPQLNKWITGFAPLAQQIRRHPSWPPPACPRPSGLRVYIAAASPATPSFPTTPQQRQLQHSTQRKEQDI